MTARNRRVYLLAGLLMIVCFDAALAKPRRSQRVQTGTWGGEHINLEVTENSATVEYDCARGTVDGPLLVDRRGRFDLSGKHTRGHPGPIRVGQKPTSRPVRYTGSIQGKVMKLTVTFVDTKAVLGTFTLQQGSEGFLRKCR
ncbi:MAG: hypothetical protein QOD75_1067 [Blastocatellia bacterium]|nr:hypothetical protein [Blastocatellia bacterium]